MDLITFLQASTLKQNTDLVSPKNKTASGADFSQVLGQLSKENFDNEALTIPNFDELSLKELESLITNIFNELDIDMDDLSEIDFNVIAQFLVELRDVKQTEMTLNSSELEDYSLKEVGEDFLKGENNAGQQTSSENSTAFFESADELADSFQNSKNSANSHVLNGQNKNEFLNELLQLMKENPTQEELSQFFKENGTQLKNMFQFGNENNPISMVNNVLEHSDVENTVKGTSDIENKLNTENTKIITNESVTFEQSVNIQEHVENDPVKTSILQNALYNENKLSQLNEPKLNSLQQTTIQDGSLNVGQIVKDVEPEMNLNNPNQQFSQKQEAHEEQGFKFASDQGSDPILEDKSGLFADTTKGDMKTQFGQVALDTSLQTKAIEPTAKLETLRYTSDVEFVDQLNGIITKHSKGLDGIEKISIQVYPKELGRIDLDLNMQQHKLSVDFIVSNDRVREIIETNFVQLTDQFDTKGVQVEKLEAKTERQTDQQRQDENNGKQKSKQQGQSDNEHEQQKQKRRLGYNTFEMTA